MNLYCKIPFGQLHERNPRIVSIAAKLGRSAGSLAMKLCNFASLDPVLQAGGIKGLSGVSQLDGAVWAEFNDDWASLSVESERLLANLGEGAALTPQEPQREPDWPLEGQDCEAKVRVRIQQGFFRATVLAAYNFRCCLTGLHVPDLLSASHIVPWSVKAEARLDPRNGLCLNALHDRAFDRGLVTVRPDGRVELSTKLRQLAQEGLPARFFSDLTHCRLRSPDRFAPNPEYLEWHYEHVFQRQ